MGKLLYYTLTTHFAAVSAGSPPITTLPWDGVTSSTHVRGLAKLLPRRRD